MDRRLEINYDSPPLNLLVSVTGRTPNLIVFFNNDRHSLSLIGLSRPMEHSKTPEVLA